MSTLTQRWLTPADKRRELQEWQALRLQPVPADKAGGYGYPDPEMFNVCHRLNVLPGLCTLQSCVGHRVENGDGGASVHAGHLWLWLDATVAAVFDRQAPGLAASSLVERVQKLWLRGGREIVEVLFVSGEHFQEATDQIVDFFTSLCRANQTGVTRWSEAGICSCCNGNGRMHMRALRTRVCPYCSAVTKPGRGRLADETATGAVCRKCCIEHGLSVGRGGPGGSVG